jgi:hypothetical protein
MGLMTIGAPNREKTNEGQPNPDFVVSIYTYFVFFYKKVINCFFFSSVVGKFERGF